MPLVLVMILVAVVLVATIILIGYQPWWGFILAAIASGIWTVLALFTSPMDLLVCLPLLASSIYAIDRYYQGAQILSSRFRNPVLAYAVTLAVGVLSGMAGLLVFPIGLVVAVTVGAIGYLTVVFGYADGWLGLTAAAIAVFVVAGPLAFNDAITGAAAVVVACACFFSYARWARYANVIAG